MAIVTLGAGETVSARDFGHHEVLPGRRAPPPPLSSERLVMFTPY